MTAAFFSFDRQTSVCIVNRTSVFFVKFGVSFAISARLVRICVRRKAVFSFILVGRGKQGYFAAQIPLIVSLIDSLLPKTAEYFLYKRRDHTVLLIICDTVTAVRPCSL